MLRQSLLQQSPFESSSSLNANKNIISIDRSLLLDIVHELHLLYNMETRDRPNNIVRVLVELHKLGATQEQLTSAFQKTRVELESIRMPDVGKINENNWEEHLGTASLYTDYLIFFDHQLPLLGLKETLAKYFYSIPYSIGSQLQPLVHLAFGIEHDLPEIITQALAYYASSYIDVSNILSYCHDYTASNQYVASNDTLADTILFDLVRADPRFDGKIDGNNTFQSAVKLLLKSKSDLINTYMMFWSSSPQSPKQRLQGLIHTATALSKAASRQQRDTAHVDLDWFLAGGQLMDAALAIQSLMIDYPGPLENWVNLLFLVMLCTFVVQGRPVMHNTSRMAAQKSWDVCTAQIVQTSFDDSKLILALSSILRARHNGDLESTCLGIANTLASFAEDGTWIKAGLGWSY